MKTDDPLAELLWRAAQQAGDDLDLRNWCLNLLGGDAAGHDGEEIIDLASLDGWHDLPKPSTNESTHDD